MYEQSNRLNTFLAWGIVISLLVTAAFAGLYVAGYGTLRYNANPRQPLFINGRVVDGTTIKLRPGTYDVAIQSPLYKSNHTQVTIGLFQTKTYAPQLTERSPDDVAGSALGVNGFYGPPELTDSKRFIDNTWLVGTVGPGSATPAAFYYQEGHWSVGYFKANGYPADLQQLPPAVATYIAQLQNKAASQ